MSDAEFPRGPTNEQRIVNRGQFFREVHGEIVELGGPEAHLYASRLHSAMQWLLRMDRRRLSILAFLSTWRTRLLSTFFTAVGLSIIASLVQWAQTGKFHIIFRFSE